MPNVVLCSACNNAVTRNSNTTPLGMICLQGKEITKDDRRRFPPIFDEEENKYANKATACLSYTDNKGLRTLVGILAF